MKWGLGTLVAATLAMSLVGCSDQPSTPAADDAERDLLVQRTVALKEQVTAAGRMTPEHRRALSVLTQDVEAWRSRTGRGDLTVSYSGPTRDGTTLAKAPSDGGSGACAPCPLIKTMGGKVCFLVEESDCRDDLIAKVCAYVCIGTTAFTAKPAVPGGTLTRP